MYIVSNLAITIKQTLLLFQHRENWQNNVKTLIKKFNNEITVFKCYLRVPYSKTLTSDKEMCIV